MTEEVAIGIRPTKFGMLYSPAELKLNLKLIADRLKVLDAKERAGEKAEDFPGEWKRLEDMKRRLVSMAKQASEQQPIVVGT